MLLQTLVNSEQYDTIGQQADTCRGIILYYVIMKVSMTMRSWNYYRNRKLLDMPLSNADSCSPITYPPSTMDHNSDNAVIAQVQSILRIANDLKEATASYSSCRQTFSVGDSRPVVDSIRLPSPRPLLPSLLEAGVSHEIATTANKIYQQRAEEFKQYIEQTVTTAYFKMAPGASVSSPDSLTSKLVSTFTEIYLRRLGLWREEILQRVKQAPRTPTRTAPKNSRSFNHVNAPIILLVLLLTIFNRSTSHFWSVSSMKTSFRLTRTKHSSLRSQIWNIGKFMYG